MNSPRATFLLVVLLGLGGIAAALLQYRANASLHAEIATLRNELQAAQVVRPLTPSTAISTADPTLTAIRDDLRALNERVQDLARTPAAAAPSGALMTGLRASAATLTQASDAAAAALPIAAWANVGNDTPAAAFQTALWAAARGELDAFAHNITFDPAARAKVDALFARLPDSMRSQFGSPEQLMALVLSDEVNKVASLQVLRETKNANDQSSLQVLLHSTNGGYKLDNFPVQHGPNGWQLVVATSTVDGVAKKLTGKTDGK